MNLRRQAQRASLGTAPRTVTRERSSPPRTQPRRRGRRRRPPPQSQPTRRPRPLPFTVVSVSLHAPRRLSHRVHHLPARLVEPRAQRASRLFAHTGERVVRRGARHGTRQNPAAAHRRRVRRAPRQRSPPIPPRAASSRRSSGDNPTRVAGRVHFSRTRAPLVHVGCVHTRGCKTALGVHRHSRVARAVKRCFPIASRRLLARRDGIAVGRLDGVGHALERVSRDDVVFVSRLAAFMRGRRRWRRRAGRARRRRARQAVALVRMPA